MMRSDYGEFGRRFWDDIFGDTNVGGGVLSEGTNLTNQGGTSGVGGLGGIGKLGSVGLGSLSSLSSFGMNNTNNNQPTSPIATSGGGGAGGDGSSLGRKQSLFGNLMKDFEGLGLKDDAASEFGSKRGSVISTR